MKIKKGDNVLIIKGKWRGKIGKVLKALPKNSKIIVQGVNIVKKHQRPRKAGQKGQILGIESPIFISNVKLICKNCKKPIKVRYEITKSKLQKLKIRICKKCNQET